MPARMPGAGDRSPGGAQAGQGITGLGNRLRGEKGVLHTGPWGTEAPERRGSPSRRQGSEVQPGDAAAGSREAPEGQQGAAHRQGWSWLSGEFQRKTLKVKKFMVSLLCLPVGRT